MRQAPAQNRPKTPDCEPHLDLLPGALFGFSWRPRWCSAGLGGSQAKTACMYLFARPRLGKPSRAGAAASASRPRDGDT